MDADLRLNEIRQANGAHLPASDRLIAELADVVRDLRQHQQSGHARPGDIYSGNLHGWMGERMPMVLSRLINSEAELTEARTKLEIAERRVEELTNAATCPSVARAYGSQCVLPVRHRGDHRNAARDHYWDDTHAVPSPQAAPR